MQASPPVFLATHLPRLLICLLIARKQVARMRELTACRHLTHSLIHSARTSVRPVRSSVRVRGPGALNSTRSLSRSSNERRPDADAPRPSQSRDCRGDRGEGRGGTPREMEGGVGHGGCGRPAGGDGGGGGRRRTREARRKGRRRDVCRIIVSLSLAFLSSSLPP